jgi:DNA topoisomerase-1|tara:strand:- start:137 stop:1090 length:954 start_codon:yes stop_codon:yes gene_type:complete
MEKFLVRKIMRKVGKKYTHKYYDKNNNEIKNKKMIEDATKGVYIAPAYDNVKINLNKGEKVLAIGYDEKGRSQYVYNKEFTASQSYKKFDKMILFGKNFVKIDNKINDDLYTVKDSKNKQIAIILKLIMECQFRIGNDVYSKKNKSYGTTTLEGKHIKVKNKNELVIDFNGKKNVRNVCTVKNKKLVKTLRQKKRTINNDDRIFNYRKGEKYYNIKSPDVNKYLKQFGKFTAKDFRTWGANIEFIKGLMENKNTELKKCIENVAIKLHNTPSICKSNYLDPELIAFYKNDKEGFRAHFNFKTDKSLYNQYIHFLEDL